MVEDPLVDLETLVRFLINDGHPFPTESLNLCAQGMNAILRPGCDPDDPIYDFYDVIGGDYDWVWDVITEMKTLGPSRKFPKHMLSLVDPDGRSMWIPVHNKAIVDGQDLSIFELKELQQPIKNVDIDSHPEYVRKLACGADYLAGSDRQDVKYKQGALLMMPITQFDVVVDPVAQTHLTALQRLDSLGFDLNLVDN